MPLPGRLDDAMKIVQIITSFVLGGAQRLVLETSDYLGSLGHEVVVLAGGETEGAGTLHEEARRRGVDVRTIDGGNDGR